MENDPQDSIAWHDMGVDLVIAGSYHSAIICFDKVLEIDPQDSAALYNKSVAIRKLANVYKGDFRKYREKALSMDPDLQNAKKAGKTILKFKLWGVGIEK